MFITLSSISRVELDRMSRCRGPLYSRIRPDENPSSPRREMAGSDPITSRIRRCFNRRNRISIGACACVSSSRCVPDACNQREGETLRFGVQSLRDRALPSRIASRIGERSRRIFPAGGKLMPTPRGKHQLSPMRPEVNS
jgi:hypothetical protein